MESHYPSFTSLSTLFATFTFLFAIRDHLPFAVRTYLMRAWHKAVEIFYPYIEIRVDEMSGEWLRYSEAYGLIETYLTNTSSMRARKLKARMDKDSKNMILSMDEYEEVTDRFKGATIWWTSCKAINRSQSFSWYPASDEKKWYVLTFHKRHRALVVDSYMKHVMEEAKAMDIRNRCRKLFTNNRGTDAGYEYRKKLWSHVAFKHPATFDTLAMEPEKKSQLIRDLDFFKKSEDYYARIGKAWKRGYLLHGPPGTGKSTMIAAMANYMDYDVYDLELIAVKDNTQLRKLLIETSSKSIIVIEDIDCSLDLSGCRAKKKKEAEEEKEEDKKKAMEQLERHKDESKVTLSGLLNFIDGLWSACGDERLIIFTTNHIEKLDPALIRTGRMDKHIEMSYCCFEGFKTLAKNYLGLDWDPVFEQVRELLEVDGVQVAPADVAERLMPTNLDDERDAKSSCLLSLVEFLNKAKEEKLKKKEGNGAEETTEEDGASVSEDSKEGAEDKKS